MCSEEYSQRIQTIDETLSPFQVIGSSEICGKREIWKKYEELEVPVYLFMLSAHPVLLAELDGCSLGAGTV